MEPSGVDPLIAGLVGGDDRAYQALYDRFGERLYRTALGIVRRREDAEDIVQEVFMSVLRSRQRISGVRDMTAYLFTALRRAAGRSAARGIALAQTEIVEAPATDPQRGGTSPCSERLERALQALPAEQREVITLKIDGELTFAQVAQVMEVSINTAASRYRYALDRLRAILEASR